MELQQPNSVSRSVQALAKRIVGLRVTISDGFSALPIHATLRRLHLSPISGVLAVICINFAAWLFYEVAAAPPKLQPPKIALAKHGTLPKISPFVPPPFQEFAVIDERPLFSPLRKKLLSPQETVAQKRPPPSFVLVGVILGSTERIAITKAPGASNSVNLTPGQSIEGWEVTAIEADHITLRAGTDTYELPLYLPSGARNGVPAEQNVAAPQSSFSPTPNQ